MPSKTMTRIRPADLERLRELTGALGWSGPEVIHVLMAGASLSGLRAARDEQRAAAVIAEEQAS